jgi:hypothetical protein
VNKYIIEAILYYAQQDQEYDKQFEEKKAKIEAIWTARDKELTALKNNVSYRQQNTFNAYVLAKPANLKTVTPWFGIAFEPLTYGSNLNAVWKSRPDKLLENKDTDDDLEWADGLINRYFGGNIDCMVSPEIALGRNSFSRVYATVAYHQFAYRMDSMRFKISDNFFAAQASNGGIIHIEEPLRFQQSNFSAGISWRFFLGQNVLLDLNGGYIFRQTGLLDLSHTTLPDGYTWSVTKIQLSESQNIPYFGARLGIGRRLFHQGVYWTLGTCFYKSQNVNTTDYILKNADTNEPVSYTSANKFDYRLNVGFSVFF